MNILITKFPFSSLYGGGELHTLVLADQLRKRRHGVFAFTSCPVLTKELRERAFPVRRWWIGRDPVSKGALALWPLLAPWAAVSLWSGLVWYRVRHGVRGLYCLSLQDKILATPVARLLGMRVVWVEHNQLEDWIRLNPLRVPYALFSRLATVVAPAQAICDQIEKLRVPKKHINYIAHWSDPEMFKPAPSDPTRVKEQFRIGFVGRLEKEKGLEYLLKAIASLDGAIPFVVHLVGEGSKREELEWLAEKLGIAPRVRFLGFQKRVEEHYASMDVVVLPSTRRETFGLVLVEAMLSEKPVIATRIGGVPEVVGDCGILIEPANVEVLADQLRHVYYNYAESLAMAKRGRLRAIEKFNLDRMVDAFESLYTK